MDLGWHYTNIIAVLVPAMNVTAMNVAVARAKNAVIVLVTAMNMTANQQAAVRRTVAVSKKKEGDR